MPPKCATSAPNSASCSAERQSWDHRVALMRSEAVDRDLLDEEARAMLGRVGKNDLVVFTNPVALR